MRWKPLNNLYNHNSIQLLNKSLFNTKPILENETWVDCGADASCPGDSNYSGVPGFELQNQQGKLNLP